MQEISNFIEVKQIKAEEILKFFPDNLKIKLRENLSETTEEIRIRAGKPVILKNDKNEKLLNYFASMEDMIKILQKICDNSIYSYQNQICNGFLTLKGGHRVGLAGNAVTKDEKVTNLNYINSLNFRIAKQIFDCSNDAIKFIINPIYNNIYNTLIISPPGVGKTTLLRDIIRKISNGIPELNFKGLTCGVVDERGELAAIDRGIAQNDLGIRTDVIDDVPKAVGMRMLIRSMCPNVIAADEIGNKEDVQAIEYAITSGVKGIFTAHGQSLEEIRRNPILNSLLTKNNIEKILLLNKNRKPILIYDNQSDIKIANT